MKQNKDLSVIIVARNEEFLSRTIDGVMENRRANTEVIVVCDVEWPSPPIKDYEDVIMIYNPKPTGQRGAMNTAIRLSRAKYIMKLDAHCILDEGFDVKLMADCEPNWVVVPRLYNLHAFDWKCKKCGKTWYQGPTPTKCKASPPCDNTTDFERIMVWKPRWHKRTDFMRFDTTLHFQYHGARNKHPDAQGDIADTMSLLGACIFMPRELYWKLGGSEEDWGSWGQQGTEWACKAWLSGGRLVVNKKTWYSHLFRTQGGDFGFPYPQSGKQVANARKMSRDLFLNNKWDKQVRPLSWLIQHFYPLNNGPKNEVPDWHTPEGKEALDRVNKAGEEFYKEKGITPPDKPLTKGVIYYTDNALKMKIATECRKHIAAVGLPIVSTSLKPLDFGKNIHLKLERGYLTYFKQILTALENSDADIIFFCEHDVMYHPSHFEFTPPRNDVYYYNTNFWRLRASDGHAVTYDTHQVNMICAYRELLLQNYRERVKRLEEYKGDNINGYIRAMGFEPGTHNRKERVDMYGAAKWQSKYPNIDIRHDNNLTASRWSQDQFRDKRNCRGWKETDDIPGWGKTKDLIKKF